MARIPKFQQRKLASEIVGTPGVDTSGQTAFTSAAAAVQSIADTFGALAVKRQGAVDKASANDTLIDFQIALQKAAQEQAIEFAGSTETPAIRVEILKGKSDELFRVAEESLATPEAKALFAAGAQTTIRRRLLDEGKIASDNQVLVAYDRMSTAQSKIANSLYEFSKVAGRSYQDKKDELLFTTQEGSLPNIEVSRSILGDKEADDFVKKSLEGNFRGVLVGMLEIAPEQAVELLKDPDFAEVLTGEEKATELKTAEARVFDFNNLMNKRRNIAIYEERRELTNRLRDGTLTLGEVEQISDDTARRIFREALLKYNPISEQQLLTMRAELQIKYEVLFTKEGKEVDGKIFDVLKPETTIEDVLEIQQLYMTAASNGIITREKLAKEGGDALNLISDLLDNKTSREASAFVEALNRFGPIARAIGPAAGAIAAVGAVLKDIHGVTDAWRVKNEMTGKFFERFKQIDLEDGEARSRLIETIIAETQKERNANRRDYKAKDPISVNGRAAIITFIHDDGEPDIEFT